MGFWALAYPVFVLLTLLIGYVNVQALSPLSEDELDQTHAAGFELQIIGDETVTAEVEAPDLFVNQIFGQNEVITRIVVQIVTRMDFSFAQTNIIDQSRGTEDITAVTEGSRDIRLTLSGAAENKGDKVVVNNVAGINQVETSINVTVVIPVSQGAAVGGFPNPFAASGPAGSTSGAGSAATVINTPAPLPQPTTPQFQRPTTLGGAVSLMETLSRQNPQAAPGLQIGISTVESLQK